MSQPTQSVSLDPPYSDSRYFHLETHSEGAKLRQNDVELFQISSEEFHGNFLNQGYVATDMARADGVSSQFRLNGKPSTVIQEKEMMGHRSYQVNDRIQTAVEVVEIDGQDDRLNSVGSPTPRKKRKASNAAPDVFATTPMELPRLPNDESQAVVDILRQLIPAVELVTAALAGFTVMLEKATGQLYQVPPRHSSVAANATTTTTPETPTSKIGSKPASSCTVEGYGAFENRRRNPTTAQGSKFEKTNLPGQYLPPRRTTPTTPVKAHASVERTFPGFGESSDFVSTGLGEQIPLTFHLPDCFKNPNHPIADLRNRKNIVDVFKEGLKQRDLDPFTDSNTAVGAGAKDGTPEAIPVLRSAISLTEDEHFDSLTKTAINGIVASLSQTVLEEPVGPQLSPEVKLEDDYAKLRKRDTRYFKTQRYLYRVNHAGSGCSFNDVVGVMAGLQQPLPISREDLKEHYLRHENQYNRKLTPFISTTSDIVHALWIAKDSQTKGFKNITLMVIDTWSLHPDAFISCVTFREELGLKYDDKKKSVFAFETLVWRKIPRRAIVRYWSIEELQNTSLPSMIAPFAANYTESATLNDFRAARKIRGTDKCFHKFEEITVQQSAKFVSSISQARYTKEVFPYFLAKHICFALIGMSRLLPNFEQSPNPRGFSPLHGLFETITTDDKLDAELDVALFEQNELRELTRKSSDAVNQYSDEYQKKLPVQERPDFKTWWIRSQRLEKSILDVRLRPSTRRRHFDHQKSRFVEASAEECFEIAKELNRRRECNDQKARCVVRPPSE